MIKIGNLSLRKLKTNPAFDTAPDLHPHLPPPTQDKYAEEFELEPFFFLTPDLKLLHALLPRAHLEHSKMSPEDDSSLLPAACINVRHSYYPSPAFRND